MTMEPTRTIDLHIHSTLSDGTDPPETIPARVREAGIGLFSVTDHDSIRAAQIIPPLLGGEDPAFVCGVEFSCKDELGKYHILGYGYDPDSDPIRQVVETGHGYRMKKVRARLDFLRTKFGFDFPKEELRRLLALENPGKPNIVNMMVRFGYAKTKEQAIREFINRVHFRSEYVRPEEAVRGILGSGGIPVLAHPCFGNGEDLILGEELRERVRRLVGFGLQGVEAFYSGFSPKMRNETLSLAQSLGLYVTAGSDYHGKNKLILLGDTGVESDLELPEGMLRFLKDVRKRNAG